MGRPTFDTAPRLSTGNADSFEIPETPSVTETVRCPVLLKGWLSPALSLEVKSASIYKRSRDPGGWECISSLSFQQVHPSVVRVVGKRLDTEQPRYLVLCWIYPQEGEAANSDLDRRFREYDKKISRDLAQQERLTTLRSRKHSLARDNQNSHRAQKRPKTNTTSASLNHTCPSRQVEENIFLDTDVCLVTSRPASVK
jgi:hypothetical protein